MIPVENSPGNEYNVIIFLPESMRHKLMNFSERRQYRERFPHVAPEVSDGKKPTQSSDIYSFGHTPAVIVGRACVIRASSRGPRCCFSRHFVEALLSLVKCLYFAIIVSFVLITGVVAAVVTYPRLVLRDS